MSNHNKELNAGSSLNTTSIEQEYDKNVNQRTQNAKARSDKSVKFSSDNNSVVLIPTRHEYAKAGFSKLFWWANEDYVKFKETAVLEIRTLMSRNSDIDCKIAQTLLYQPNNRKALADRFNIDYDTLMSSHGSRTSSQQAEVSMESDSRNDAKTINLASVVSQLDLKQLGEDIANSNRNNNIPDSLSDDSMTINIESDLESLLEDLPNTAIISKDDNELQIIDISANDDEETTMSMTGLDLEQLAITETGISIDTPVEKEDAQSHHLLSIEDQLPNLHLSVPEVTAPSEVEMNSSSVTSVVSSTVDSIARLTVTIGSNGFDIPATLLSHTSRNNHLDGSNGIHSLSLASQTSLENKLLHSHIPHDHFHPSNGFSFENVPVSPSNSLYVPRALGLINVRSQLDLKKLSEQLQSS